MNQLAFPSSVSKHIAECIIMFRAVGESVKQESRDCTEFRAWRHRWSLDGVTEFLFQVYAQGDRKSVV